MYDPIETDVSYDYMLKLKESLKSLRFAIIGGWGVFLHVKKEYRGAFGKEYLRSRDIDIFIDSKEEINFLKNIKSLGFIESAYKFRYELVYDREEKKIITPEQAKKKFIFNLIYIFLDVFSNKETKTLGSWFIPDLEKAQIEKIEEFPVLNIDSLLQLKTASFFEREKLDKELKDACDIFALLFYSEKKFSSNLMVRKVIEKIITRDDLQEYIAENVLGDISKTGLVVGMLKGLRKG